MRVGELQNDMKIYTRSGDQGSTSLFGNERVSKSDLRISVIGTVDELNALLGVARTEGLPKQCDEVVLRLQNQLFDLGAELASPDPGERGTDILQAEEIAQQEAVIDELEHDLTPLTSFILPGGSKAAATLHLARCVCRRAERELVTLCQTQTQTQTQTQGQSQRQAQDASLRGIVLEFINRTSDLLFVLARAANAEAGTADVLWTKSR